MGPTLFTERLRLTPPAESDLEAVAALHADGEVMRHIPPGTALTPDQAANLLRNWRARFAAEGFGWWILVEAETGETVGAAALHHLDHDPTQPYELAWRLRRDRWGRGYAPEAAGALARYAFDTLDADALYAVARLANTASLRVMHKLGMRFVGIERHWGEDLPTYVLRR